jgi:hypothetical protein
VTDLAPPAGALAVAAASLEQTGVFLLGEVHGVAETPRAILGLVERLGVRALAFEWSYDELDGVVQPVLSTGSVASDVLWRLPSSAEVFSGDGRFTAGHVRLLEHLGDRLDRIVLLDRAGWEASNRERGMTRRLLAARRRNSPLLAILGASHVVRAARRGESARSRKRRSRTVVGKVLVPRRAGAVVRGGVTACGRRSPDRRGVSGCRPVTFGSDH